VVVKQLQELAEVPEIPQQCQKKVAAGAENDAVRLILDGCCIRGRSYHGISLFWG
jgi:hypothetical protein